MLIHIININCIMFYSIHFFLLEKTHSIRISWNAFLPARLSHDFLRKVGEPVSLGKRRRKLLRAPG